MGTLTLHLPRLTRVAPVALTWALALAIAVLFALTYLADGLPSPYGVCYASRGRPIPCEVKSGARVTPASEPPASLRPVLRPR